MGPCCRNPWYVSVSGAWEQRETVHEVDDARTFVKFQGGFLANAALGLRCDSFRLELETSFMNNGVDSAGAGGLSSRAAGNVNLHAYMFNVYHDVEFKNCCWKPYVGAVIGTYQSELNGLNPEFFDQIGAPFAGQPINATSNMPLAYQFRAGVTHPFGCHAELYSGYRYFRGEELEFASAPFASFAPTFHPDGAKIHAIELGVRVNF
jgi:opacity protein-like surface antigen